MSRRSTPQRIDEARRAATRARLIGDRVTRETADAWIAAWEAKAAEDGLERGSAYWQAGWTGSLPAASSSPTVDKRRDPMAWLRQYAWWWFALLAAVTAVVGVAALASGAPIVTLDSVQALTGMTSDELAAKTGEA